MDRIKTIASILYDKDLAKILSDLNHNPFYNHKDKTIIEILTMGDIRFSSKDDINSAMLLAKELMSMNSVDKDFYQKRYQKLLKNLEDF